MPIYEYRCERGHTFEVMQSMADDPLTSCSTCEAPVQRVFHPVAVHFKGSGFYNTDYGKNKGGSDTAPKADDSKPDAKSDSKSSGAKADSSSGSGSTSGSGSAD